MISRPFRSVLWTQLNATAGDVAVLRLELHRHLPETSRLGDHSHRHWQALVYLSGRGTQMIGRTGHEIGPGTLLIIPPERHHSFRRAPGQAPLCLMLDFRAGWPKRTTVRSLSAVEIARIRSLLANIARTGGGGSVPDKIARAAAALDLLAAVAEFSGWHERTARRSTLTVLHQVQRALEVSPTATPRSIAASLDYHPDHLSRLVRQETGLGLRALTTRIRLQRTQRLLRLHRLVRDAAAAAGFDDQNYFARWFRKQTGLSPTAWLKTS